MKKIIVFCGLLVIVAAVSVFVKASTKTSSLLLANIEALTDIEDPATGEADREWETCYYVNVWTDDAGFLLHCSDCRFRKGHGQPVAKCPKPKA